MVNLNFHLLLPGRKVIRYIKRLIEDTKIIKGLDMESNNYNDPAMIGGCSVPVRVNRKSKPDPTIVDVNGIRIGSAEVVIIAGPCSVENHEQLIETAKAVKSAGGMLLRGGAFKPRSSPYNFQGLGEEGLKLLIGGQKGNRIADCYRSYGYPTG